MGVSSTRNRMSHVSSWLSELFRQVVMGFSPFVVHGRSVAWELLLLWAKGLWCSLKRY